MKKKFLPVFLRAGAVDDNVINNAWLVDSAMQALIANEGNLPPLAHPTALTGFLLSPANRQAAQVNYQFNTGRVAEMLEAKIQETGNRNASVDVTVYPRTGDGVFNTKPTGYCSTSGNRVVPVTIPVKLTKKIQSDVLKISEADFKALKVNKRTHEEINMLLLEARFIDMFNQTIFMELFSRNGSMYNYIGGFSSYDGVVPRFAGEDLPLFMDSKPELNPSGEIKFSNDMMHTGMPANSLMLSNALGSYYATLKRWTTPNSGQGIDWSMPSALNQSIVSNENMMGIANTGLENPLLVLTPGALQLVTVSMRKALGNFTNGSQQRFAYTDKYLGLNIDMIINQEACGSDIEYTVWFETYYELIKIAHECVKTVPRLKDVTGVFLYNIAASDIHPKNLGKYNYEARNYGTTADATPYLDIVCSSDCKVSLSGARNSDGDLIVTASYTPRLGQETATPTFAWTQNGVAMPDTTPYISLSAGNWASGDTFGITYTQGTCTATATYQYNATNCSALSIKVGASTYASGDTVALGNVAAGASAALELLNVGGAGVSLFVSAVSSTDADLVVNAAIPKVIADGASLVGTLVTNGAAGAHSATLTFSSNDCTAPSFTLDVTWTVV